MANVYVYVGPIKNAPSPRDWKPGVFIQTTDTPIPGKTREWVTDGMNWQPTDAGVTVIDPAESPFLADFRGVNDAQPGFLAAALVADNITVQLTGSKKTKGRDMLYPSPGQYLMKPWAHTPSGLSMSNEGETGRVVLKFDHRAIAADTAMFTFDVDDGAVQNTVAGRGSMIGIEFDGRKEDIGSHVAGPWLVHGFDYRDPGSSTPGHNMQGCRIHDFPGWGVVMDSNFHQLRWDDVKIGDNYNGAWIKNAADSKFTKLGMGGNEYTALLLDGTTTAMFEECDIWAPSQGNWKGQYGIQQSSGYGNRFVNCDLNIPVLLSGANSGTGDSRKRMMQMVFDSCTFKMTPEVALGYLTNHNGDTNYRQADGTTYAPQAVFTLLDGGGLKVGGSSSFGFGTISMINGGDDIEAAVDAARPDYIARFMSGNQTGKPGLMTDRRGIFTLGNDVEVCHFQPVIENFGATDSPTQPYNLRKPWPFFKRRLTNDDRFLDSPFLKIVAIQKSIHLHPGKNYGPRYVACKGQNIPVVYHPLAYLAMSLTVHLADGVANFTLMDLADISTDWVWALRYW